MALNTLWKVSCVAAAVLLAGCTPHQEAVAPVVKAQPVREINEIVGVRLFSTIDLPKCDGRSGTDPVRPCWLPYTYGSKQDKPDLDGRYKILLLSTAVPRYTNPEIEATLWNGKIHSIDIETSLGVSDVVGLLSDKYGPVSRREQSDGGDIYQWDGDTTRMFVFTNSPRYGDHGIVVSSREYLFMESERIRAESSDGF